MGVGAGIAAVALGASVIEKHFTLRRADGGVDSAFSLEPEELAQLVIESERAWLALGNISYGSSPIESKSQVFRRSLYVAQDIAEGELFSSENIRVIRPGFGLAPKFFDIVIGMPATKALKRGMPLTWEALK